MSPHWIPFYFFNCSISYTFAVMKIKDAMENKTIGSKIKDLVYKKGIPIPQFAEMINCSRKHVYKIFDRNTMDIQQLAIISKALNYDFFKDLSENYDLAQPVEESEEERAKQKAITQFFEVVPDLLKKMGYDASIFFGKPLDDEKKLPMFDFIITPFNITLTYGETYEQRANGFFGDVMDFTPYEDNLGHKVIIETSHYTETQLCNIVLDYKTDKEWEEILTFAIETIKRVYTPNTIRAIKYINQF